MQVPDPRTGNDQSKRSQLYSFFLAGSQFWTPFRAHSGFPSMSSDGCKSFIFKIQVLCSVFAGVYNEFLIKGKGADIDIMIQNVFMYLDSIVCNLLLLGGKGNLSDAFTTEALSSLMSPLVLLLILNNAVLGIVTSLFLQVIQSFAQFHTFFCRN